LAGAFDGLAPHYSAFGLPIGQAFQLRDDLLGALGDAGVTGKPVGDDLREGKPTLLVALANELADDDGRRLLSEIGQSTIADDVIVAIQRMLVDCGAVAEIESAIAARVTTALDALDAAPLPEAVRAALRRLAADAVWRDR
jgi:geranylgeranyl diphosphate synthase type I